MSKTTTKKSTCVATERNDSCPSSRMNSCARRASCWFGPPHRTAPSETTTARSSPDVLPALIERARQEVVLARVVGKFTVDFGIASVRRRLIGDSEPVTDLSVDSLVDLSEANETMPSEPAGEQPVRQER